MVETTVMVDQVLQLFRFNVKYAEKQQKIVNIFQRKQSGKETGPAKMSQCMSYTEVLSDFIFGLDDNISPSNGL